MPADVLTDRAVNRALLARQHLLAPAPAGDPGQAALDMVRQLCGLQAQAPFPPYYGLLARLEGFRPEHLATLLESRKVVRIALMRSTIHLVTADDALAWRPLIQPVLDQGLASNWGKGLAGLDLDRVAARGRELTTEQPLTSADLGAALTRTFPDHPGDALAMAVRCRVPLVQVPPRAVWGKSGLAKHTPADVWLDRPNPEPPADRPQALTAMIERYLAAFGPATVQDVQTWSGLTRLREIVEPVRDRLRTFTDERGRELFDLPDSPRPDPDVPAPPRLAAEFDNLILSHDDRTRVMAADDRRRLFKQLNSFPGSVLLDGFVAGAWRVKRAKSTATVTIELFRARVPARDRDALEAEAARVLAVTAPAATPDVRFVTPAD
ncbi:MAG TPA: winged helix DNA-binding domain-containing protein [Streptosporangiaceae bacterium]|nr:winged helix DNA-binding domain-containing protein [Streptosporangiaceae bacterium]